MQVWIDRDDFNLGTLVRGRQSHFVDPFYDPLRYLKAATDDTSGSKAVVRRRGTLTGIATGTGPLVAAGYRHSDKKHVRYSSAGPSSWTRLLSSHRPEPELARLVGGRNKGRERRAIEWNQHCGAPACTLGGRRKTSAWTCATPAS